MDHAQVDELLTRYLRNADSLSARRRWFESPTSERFAALHLTAAEADADPAALTRYATEIRGAISRVDPLRAFAVSMAALALSTRTEIDQTLTALTATIEGFDQSVRPMGKTDRARAVPCLVFHSAPLTPIEAAGRVREVHHAWNALHRWMTTGRHMSFASMVVAEGMNPRETAATSASIHDLLNERRAWHEWDASILLSFGPSSPTEAVDRYEAAVAGFMGGDRKPPAAARDDLALVSLAGDDPERAGNMLARRHRALRDLRPRPSLQVALAIAAVLVLADGSSGRRPALLDGFALYAYAEALREESPD